MNTFKNINQKLAQLEKRSRRKAIDFDLDKHWLNEKLTECYCEATGIKFDLSSDPYINPYYPTIDRKDNEKGYTKDNCWLVCNMFNIAKAEHSLEVFETWAKAFVGKYEGNGKDE
jgi:hypothetical protein